MLSELVHGAKRNPIWFGSIGAITVVQGWLGWEFWGAFTDAPAEQIGLRAVGLAFVGGEVVALDMASRAALQSEQTRANTLRAMWLSLAVLNLGIDVNALSRVLQTVELTRADDMAAYEARETRARDLRILIDEADDPLPGGRLLPIDAYDAALQSKQREIELAVRAPMWRQRQLERERGALETGREVARQVAGWRTELTTLTATPETAEARPQAGAVEFAPLAAALTQTTHAVERAFGNQRARSEITPEQVRNGIALAASIAMKIMLTFGVWAGLERGAIGSPAPSDAPPSSPRLLLEPPPQRRRPVLRFGRNGVRI
jgi:hypothetical protein